MMEADDRLAGDPVWELFPASPALARPAHRLRDGAISFVLIAWIFSIQPPLAVILACLASAYQDFRAAWQASRVIPDKAGGRICSLFGYAWGAWKLGMVAFVMLFVAAIISALRGEAGEMPPACIVAMVLWVLGFVASAILTAGGLVLAFRSGMRVWVGEGINQTRTLLFAMLMVGFACLVLLPGTILLISAPAAIDTGGAVVPMLVVIFSLMLGAPVVLLILLDWFTRRIAADRPGKFGPKVPAVGKWG
ncbi:hypothetical protein TA3x_004968 [Tundrisphaera sp. TA3]|uniref:hypothetical protein n=1 Tax=Tundrisphaera sp. TA3 TaxID=3435775 RepID=UPI003EB8852C